MNDSSVRIEVRQSFPLSTAPALDESEIATITSDLPVKVQIIAPPGAPPPPRVPLMGAQNSEFLILLGAALGFFSAGFFGEMGKDAWSSLKTAMGRLLKHQANAVEGRIFQVRILTMIDGRRTIIQIMLGEPSDIRPLPQTEWERRFDESLQTIKASLPQIRKVAAKARRKKDAVYVDVGRTDVIVWTRKQEKGNDGLPRYVPETIWKDLMR